MLSGVAGALMPQRVANALELPAHSGRAVAETRAGLGGAYAALGAYGLLSRQRAAQRAVGATWLGAAAMRVASLRLDRPRTDLAFWTYLAVELILGTAAITRPR